MDSSQVDQRQHRGSVALLGRTFFDFLMVTRETPGTGFMPSFCIAFRDFFSLRLCFPRIEPSSAEDAHVVWDASPTTITASAHQACRA